MKLLALDTSAEGCSVALLCDEHLTSRSEVAPRGHTRLLMPMIRDLLRDAGLTPLELDAVAFACGPGSFTGLRIATGVVQGLAYGLDIPVVPVSSLQAVAAEAIDRFSMTGGDRVAVAFDARMGEVYWGCFECRDSWPRPLGPERVCEPGDVALESGTGQCFGAGSGWRLHHQFPAELVNAIEAVDDSLIPDAARVVRLASEQFALKGGVEAAQAQPVYIRDEVAWKKLPGR